MFVPSAAAILADLGADVIKVEEPRHGDPYRGLRTAGLDNTVQGLGARMTQANRGKRSMGIDLKTDDGRQLLLKMLDEADVFMSSLRSDALERLGLTQSELQSRNPSLIYARGDAYGPNGPDHGRAGFDATAFWAAGAVAGTLMPLDADHLIQQPSSFGDRVSALALALGVVAALLERQRTGRAPDVSASLLHSAAWVLANDLLTSDDSDTGDEWQRFFARNPLTGGYRCSDGRWLMLHMTTADHLWDEFCECIGASELRADHRFSDDAGRTANAAALRQLLEAHFDKRSYVEWCSALNGFVGPWAPVRTLGELRADPQVALNKMVVPIDVDADQMVVRAPLSVGSPPAQLGRSPELGEHTEAVMLEIGYTWADIERLKVSGAIG